MVLETTSCYQSVSTVDAEKRIIQSREMSSQKQESNHFSSGNKRSRESKNSTNNSNDEYGSWGPMFKNRENFNNMHLF